MKKILSCIFVIAFFVTNIQAQRITRTINDKWEFSDKSGTSIVNFPHTWNAHDTWDETPGYRRGLGNYHKVVRINDDLSGKKVYIRFEGALQDCRLEVNGKNIGRHVGGYTAFIFDITDAVKQGDNDFTIKLSNKHDANIPPLSADFTFYGGVYRDVELVFTQENHICNTHYASNGVYLTTPKVGQTSTVHAKTLLDTKSGKFTLTHTLFAPDGSKVSALSKKVKISKEGITPVEMSFDVKDAKLWDVDSPLVYRVETVLTDASGKILDKVNNPLGFRTFSFDTENGFTLNGRSLKLWGTNRHQDYLDMGNALPDDMHERDVMLLKNMGGNFLRISHYPQDPIVCQVCDREGIVNSVEIPIVNSVTESEEFRKNCVEMAKEMVCQNYNNPSVIIWAYMNEVLLVIPQECRKGDRRKEYFEFLCQTAGEINKAIKELDPYRFTMLPCDSDPRKYKESGAAEIPDIIGWNYYRGWYGQVFEDFDKSLNRAHELFQDKPVIISEYGAGVDPRIHSSKPVRFDFSNEYGLMFHSYYINAIRNKSYVAGSNVWNLNDFYAENRVDAVPHVNNKGLTGLDRTPKDVYLLYQANLLKTPYLKIGGRNWKLRAGNEGDTMEISVFSNQSPVSLTHNGKPVAVEKTRPDLGITTFLITPTAGDNSLCARGGAAPADGICFQYAAVPKDMSKFTSLNVSLGSDIQFEDDIQGTAWIPEQEYQKGSWGYVGGTRYGKKRSSGWQIGTSEDIFGTINNPIFQTQRIGIESFKADVPDGTYYVYLYFAELAVNSKGESLPYNLGNDPEFVKEDDREFSVRIGDEIVLKDYNIKEEVGGCRASIEKFTVNVQDGKGLSIDFIPEKGKPVLNAVRIYKCF